MESILAAICEDEPKVLDYLRSRLSASLASESFSFDFECFSSGTDLLSAVSSGKCYQILFLDIEMPEINGIDVCRKIRSFSEDALVIFISNKEEMVFQTFEVQPFRFIRKSRFKEELPALSQSILSALTRKKGALLTVTEQFGSNVYSFNINDIIYIEAVGKQCRIVTHGKEQALRIRLTDLEEKLSDHGFIKPHRSYLVNCRYIFSIENTSLLLDDQTRVPLSRKRIKDIKQEFMNFARGESYV